jgi:hypothetical protein
LRRATAAAGAIVVQILAIAVFVAMDDRRSQENPQNATSFTWLYLSPLAPPETPPEVEIPLPPVPILQMPRVLLYTPEEFDPYAVRIEDLRLVSVPTLQVIPYNQPGGGGIRLGLGSYFACDVENYDSLSREAQNDCAMRLAALRQEQALADPNALLFVLTASELRQWNRWERENQTSGQSAALPCMNTGINLAALNCLVSNITGGYDTENNPPSNLVEAPER